MIELDGSANPAQVVAPARVDFSAEDRQWIADRIQEILAGGRLTLGSYGEQFEQEFADFLGARHAVAVNSGTAALEIILRTLEIAGRDVLVPANTNYATVAPVLRAGGRPVLMDTDPESLGTSPAEVERRLTKNTAGVIVVHIGGVVSRHVPELQELVKRRGLWLVEDAAHAHGSSLGGVAAGTFGVAGAFSFYPTKVMTSGEGGMIVTNSDEIAAEARIYRDQGKQSFTRNAHVRHGYNWRLSEPHAVIGLRHLQRLPEMLHSRRRSAAAYDAAFADSELLEPLHVPQDGVSNYYKYIVLPKRPIERAIVKRVLRESYGVILGGEVYEEPLQRQPIFKDLAVESLPLSEELCGRHLCLPMFSGMNDSQINQVVEGVKTVLQSCSREIP